MSQTQIIPNKLCAHCTQPFSCGCQKIAGVDGKIVHKTCKPQYDLIAINKK